MFIMSTSSYVANKRVEKQKSLVQAIEILKLSNLSSFICFAIKYCNITGKFFYDTTFNKYK